MWNLYFCFQVSCVNPIREKNPYLEYLQNDLKYTQLGGGMGTLSKTLPPLDGFTIEHHLEGNS